MIGFEGVTIGYGTFVGVRDGLIVVVGKGFVGSVVVVVVGVAVGRTADGMGLNLKDAFGSWLWIVFWMVESISNTFPVGCIDLFKT